MKDKSLDGAVGSYRSLAHLPKDMFIKAIVTIMLGITMPILKNLGCSCYSCIDNEPILLEYKYRPILSINMFHGAEGDD